MLGNIVFCGNLPLVFIFPPVLWTWNGTRIHLETMTSWWRDLMEMFTQLKANNEHWKATRMSTETLSWFRIKTPEYGEYVNQITGIKYNNNN